MMHFIRSLVSVFILSFMIAVPNAVAVLNSYDRQEFAFENALADKNPGFESGVTQWTASGGTFVSNSGTQIVPNSKQFATWDSNSASQTLQTAAVTVPKTGNCEFSIWIAVPSGTATHTITVTDGSNDLVTAQTITNNTNALKHIVNFPCPASGTVRGKFTSVASNEPSISLDNARLGSATNVGTVQQAIHKGSISMTGCTDWTRSNGAFGDFAATAGCTYTVTGDVLAPATVIPGFRLQNVAPGRYLILARGYFGKNITTTNADISFRFSDGTNTFSEQITTSAASSSGQAIGIGQISGAITYSTTQPTLTIQVQGQTSSTASSTAAFISDDGGSNATSEINGLQFEVYYFPTSEQSVVMPAAQGWYVDANIAGANPSLGVAAVSSYTEITNASLTMTPRTGSAAVGIMCSSTNAAASPTTSSSTCSAGSESLGANFNLPRSGVYEVCIQFSHFARADQAESLFSTFQLIETPTNAQTLTQEGGSRITSGISGMTVASGTLQASYIPNTNCSLFNWSAGNKGVRLMYEQRVTGTPNDSLIVGDADSSGGQQDIRLTVRPATQQQQAIIANSVIARDAVNGQVTTINTIVSPTTTYAATADVETINASTSGGAWTLSLPAAAGVKGKKYHINQTADTANALTIDPNSTETVCGQSTIVVRGLRDSITIQSDGTNWIGLDQSCWRMTTARLDCDSASTIQIDRQYSVSTIGNISGGTCAVTMPTGNYSGTPDCGANWNGNGASNDMYAVCSSATSCAVGSIGAATTAQLHFSCRGPR